MARLYTRSGDDGRTGLSSGARASKAGQRIEALGAVDEANACIGLARAHLADDPDLDRVLSQAQHRLLDLGADLAAPGAERRVGPVQAAALEAAIDELDGQLEPLRAFILPGGTAGAAALHLARTVCRRAEREVVRLAQSPGETAEPAAQVFLNRLSDLLFAAARYANRRAGDVLWRGLG